MKRYIAILLALAMVLVSFSACGKSGSKNEGASLEDLDPIEITIAHSEGGDPTNHIHGASLAFKDYVETASDGKIKVNIAPGGALGDADACMMQAMSGTLEIAGSISDGSLAAVSPDWLVFAIPYLFKNDAHALDVVHGKFGDKIWSGVTEKGGVLPLCVVSAGFRSTTNSKHPIKTPADFKDLSIRTMNMGAHIKIMESLGASVTPLSWTELYSALQTGVMDGQENGLPSIYMGNLYEVQKYLTLDGHVWTADAFVMSQEWYDKLPTAYQHIVDMGGMKMTEVCQRLADVETDIAMDFLPTRMEVYDLTDAEREQFKNACQGPTIEYIRANVEHPELVDELMSVAEQSLKNLGY